mgnify:CR=1 FL=1
MVYVSASADESCNLPMMEANACGIPVVVFDCRGDYSDHCEYIKYGIVVDNTKKGIIQFPRVIMEMYYYHFCTRFLKINCFVPSIPYTKFYDFPLSLAEWHEISDYKFIEIITAKIWHEQALKYYKLA